MDDYSHPCFRRAIVDAASSVFQSVLTYIEDDFDEFTEERTIECSCKKQHFNKRVISCTPRFINPGYGFNYVKVTNPLTGEIIDIIAEDELDKTT